MFLIRALHFKWPSKYQLKSSRQKSMPLEKTGYNYAVHEVMVIEIHAIESAKHNIIAKVGNFRGGWGAVPFIPQKLSFYPLV